MRAAAAQAGAALRTVRSTSAISVPRPGPGQVLVRVGMGGICGSDLHYYFEGRNGSFVVREPLIPGHEASGVVSAVGPGVNRVKVGPHFGQSV